MNYCIKKFHFVLLICFLVSCNNKTAEEHINSGIKQTEKQQYDKALSSFKKAIEADPNNALAHYTLAGIYTYMDMNEEAINEFRKAIDLDSSYPDPHYSIGFVYEKLGRIDEAKKEYKIFDNLKNHEKSK